MNRISAIFTGFVSTEDDGDGIKSPFDGVKPNFDFLGADFTTTWQWWLGGLWGLIVIIASANLLLSTRHLRHIKNEHNAQKSAAAQGKVTGAIVFLVCAVIVPAIITGVIFFAQAGK